MINKGIVLLDRSDGLQPDVPRHARRRLPGGMDYGASGCADRPAEGIRQRRNGYPVRAHLYRQPDQTGRIWPGRNIRELNLALVEASRRAAGKETRIAGDLTMTGEQLAPIGRMDFEELVTVYREQIGYLVEAGVDLLVVETMMSLQECRAALIAAKETCPALPVMVTMTFEKDGRSLYGTDAATAAVVLESLGADAVGANCSTGPDAMADIIRRMASVTRIPIIAKPNAGLPSLDSSGKTVYDMDAPSFGREMEAVYAAGAVILGGCCGTTPAHIGRLAEAVKGKKPADVPRGRMESGI